MSGDPHETSEFIEALVDGNTAFVPFEEAISNPQVGACVVAKALADADDWHRRFAAFFARTQNHAGIEIVAAIESVRRKMHENGDENGLAFDE